MSSSTPVPAPIDPAEVDAVIAACRAAGEPSTAHAFFEAARRSGNPLWALLGDIAGMRLEPEDVENPFLPFWTDPNGNETLTPKHLDESARDLLEPLARNLKDAAFQARIADTLWVRFRRERIKGFHVIGEVAVAAYLRAAEEGEDYKAIVKSYRRCLALARKMSKDIAPAIASLSARIDSVFPGDDDLLLHGLLMLAAEFGDKTDALRLAERTEARARDLGDKARVGGEDRRRNFTWAGDFFDVAVELYKAGGDALRADQAAVARAETTVYEARLLDEAGLPLLSRPIWFEAIGQFRATSLKESRTPELLDRMHAAGRGMLGMMSPEPMERDEKLIAQAISLVSGRPFLDAVCALAKFLSPPSFEALQADVVTGKSFLADRFFAVEDLALDGSTTQAAVSLADVERQEQKAIDHTIETLVAKRAIRKIQEDAKNIIEPAHNAILAVHRADPIRLHELLSSSAFIPPDRMDLWVAGFCHGFDGDYVIALHLLIPQIEHAFRHVLQAKGVAITTLEHGKIPERKHVLDKLLGQSVIEDALGADTIRQLTVILTKPGVNLRHEMAHGLLRSAAFWTAPAAYLFWLLFRIAVLMSSDVDDETHR